MTSVLGPLVLFEKISTAHYNFFVFFSFFLKHPAHLNHSQQHEMHLWRGNPPPLIKLLHCRRACWKTTQHWLAPCPSSRGWNLHHTDSVCFMSDQVLPRHPFLFRSIHSQVEKNVCFFGGERNTDMPSAYPITELFIANQLWPSLTNHAHTLHFPKFTSSSLTSAATTGWLRLFH